MHTPHAERLMPAFYPRGTIELNWLVLNSAIFRFSWVFGVVMCEVVLIMLK